MRVTGKQQEANVYIHSLVMAPTEQQKCLEGAQGALSSSSDCAQACPELPTQGHRPGALMSQMLSGTSAG